MYDRQCSSCGVIQIDCLEPVTPPIVMCDCGQQTQRVWLSTSPTVIGDECDIHIRHGLCWPDGTPRHFRSKEEIARAAKEKGLVNVVQHLGRPGGDRSPHTTKWV